MTTPMLSRTMLLRVGLGAVLAAAVFALLSLVSRAPEQGARLEAQSQAMAELKVLPDPAKAGPYPAGAVCRLGLTPAATVLKARIVNAAAAAGVTLGELNLAASPADTGQSLSTLHVTLTGESLYPAGVTWLRILAEGDPALFVDRLRIGRQSGGRVSIALEGRIYCGQGGEP